MRGFCKLLATSSLTILFLFVFAIENAQAQTYSGRATAVKATVITGVVPGVTTAVSDTGPLPAAGGSINLGSASANVANILTAGVSTVSSSGGGNLSQSTASIANVDINVAGLDPGLRVQAAAVASTTSCTCPSGTCTGGSTITTLLVGGNSVTVTGAANQTVIVTIGTVTLTLVINQQIVSPSSLTVNALHATFTDSLTGISTDVIVSQSHSDIVCVLTPGTDRYSGDATGIRLGVTTAIPASQVVTIVSDTGFLPKVGGNISVSTASVNVPGVLTTGIVTSNTSGGAPGGNEESSQSNSTVNNLNASLIGAVTITATILQSNTLCTCSLTTPTCSGGSVVTGLTVAVGGVPISITILGTPNQIVLLPLGLGSIIINEQFSAGPGDITVNALHVLLTPVGLASTDLVIAHSHSDIQCSVGPTAGGVTVEGRTLDSSGQPLSNVQVFLTDQNGETWSAVSSLRGYFVFDDVPSGRAYMMEARRKGLSFAPQFLKVEDSISGIEFIPEE